MTYDYDKLREMVARCKWQWAVTMIEVPHEYIHRDHCALTREEFYYFVSAQREIGIVEQWGAYKFPYLYLDGYKYWTMGDPFANTFILNRQKVFREFDFLEWPIYRDYKTHEMEIVAKSVMKTFDGMNIFECGFGNGDFVRHSKVEPEVYYGVDPSKKAIAQFRKVSKGFYRRCAVISFEQSVKKWLESDSVIIALFGAPSYFMRQYLAKLGQSGLEYFLMFYNEGYCPDEFKEMHHFPYGLDELKSMFRNAYVYKGSKYTTFSSRKVDWQKPEQESLFDT